jgi:hypothetical protein
MNRHIWEKLERLLSTSPEHSISHAGFERSIVFVAPLDTIDFVPFDVTLNEVNHWSGGKWRGPKK